MAIVLALDIGTECGMAVGHTGMMVSGGYANIDHRKADAPRRMVHVLNEVAAAARPDRVVYCAPAMRRAKGKRSAPKAALVQAVRDWAADNGIECVPVTNGDVKKAFTGDGNASTLSMLSEAERRGFLPSGMAEARAIAVFHHALTGAAA